MSTASEFSYQTGKVVLLSIKPKYAGLIFTGGKRVEFRRYWPVKSGVRTIVVYASLPIQMLVGILSVGQVEEHGVDGLYRLAADRNGGVTYDELLAYIAGKEKAYAVLLDHVKPAEVQVTPKDIIPTFTPPQSFAYLKQDDYRRVLSAMFPTGLAVSSPL